MTDNSFISPADMVRPLPSIDLEKLSDDAIKKLITDGYKLLDKRRREHEKQVKEQIKQLASNAGIRVSFREPAERKKRNTRSEESN